MERPFRVLASLSAASLALLLASCGGIANPSENRVDVFSGVVPPGGQGQPHAFSVDKTGEISVRLTALSPTPSAVVGTQLMQSSGGNCNLFYGRDNFTGLNRDVLQLPISKGNYCVIVFDANNLLLQAQTYTLQVSHP
jgi:hypothetical protein